MKQFTSAFDYPDLKLTYDFIKRNKIRFDMYRLMPFPNTSIYQGGSDWDACKVHLYHQGLRKVKRLVGCVCHKVKGSMGCKLNRRCKQG